jgi:hypothetical protein
MGEEEGGGRAKKGAGANRLAPSRLSALPIATHDWLVPACSALLALLTRRPMHCWAMVIRVSSAVCVAASPLQLRWTRGCAALAVRASPCPARCPRPSTRARHTTRRPPLSTLHAVMTCSPAAPRRFGLANRASSHLPPASPCSIRPRCPALNASLRCLSRIAPHKLRILPSISGSFAPLPAAVLH